MGWTYSWLFSTSPWRLISGGRWCSAKPLTLCLQVPLPCLPSVSLIGQPDQRPLPGICTCTNTGPFSFRTVWMTRCSAFSSTH